MINTLASVGGMDIDEGTSKIEIIYVSVANYIDLFNAYGTLIYFDMKIRDENVVAMVDSGATHTFVASKIVREYGLKVVDCPTKMKTVNSAAQPGYGVASNVPLKIRH